MRKLELRETQQLIPIHAANKQRGQNLSPGSSDIKI